MAGERERAPGADIDENETANRDGDGTGERNENSYGNGERNGNGNGEKNGNENSDGNGNGDRNGERNGTGNSDENGTGNSDENGTGNSDGNGTGHENGDGATTDSDPLIRPFGYVEDRPIVRGIGDRDLYLGNALAATPRYHGREFEFVLSLTEEAYPLTTHHRPLVDGPGNEWSAFEETVDTSRSLYRRTGSVLIHCKAGISRSSTVVATTIAVEEGRSLHDALAIVQDARPFAVPNPALHELAVVYLAANR